LTTITEVVTGWGWLGLKLDTARNRLGRGRIGADSASVSVWVVSTDEERMIARYASQTLAP
jgi:acetate kinase